MNLKLIRFDPQFQDTWDSFVMGNSNGTFLHTRKYLSYHLNRFDDTSYLIYQGEKLVGVIPLASQNQNPEIAISHPGISYGGVIHDGKLLGESLLETLNLICLELKKNGYSTFRYKTIPFFYNSFPAQDDIYFLHQLGANISRCDLSTTVSLRNQLPISRKRVRLAEKFGDAFDVRDSFASIQDFWTILLENLLDRHDSSPTHSIEEITQLHTWFPNQIQLFTLYLDDLCLAGLIVYKTRMTWHIQYMSASESGRTHQAMDLLVQIVLTRAEQADVSFLDFGHSNEDGGRLLNEGLYQFKSKFGGGGVPLLEFSLSL